eukprot:TRINITY_DN94611_c0_g1_i1.p1 TRINITY_DN94611_c0_g1~~TRINITY_DN94611_c0_g1_i1.p1  ORF type:complete len:388 (-),score=45.64 TRINITY_DN94611_c0_g1_i1:31-1125(-)
MTVTLFVAIASYSSACFCISSGIAVGAEQAAHLTSSGFREGKQPFQELHSHWKLPSSTTCNVLASLTLCMVGIRRRRRHVIHSAGCSALEARLTTQSTAMADFADSRKQQPQRLCGASTSAMLREKKRQLCILQRCSSSGAEKPEMTTLYTKAGSDGKSIGDCPFSHAVRMALSLKGVKYQVVPCTQDTKPQWLLDDVGGKMPCVYHEGSAHVETSEILKWIDCTFSGLSLSVPEDASDSLVNGFGIFKALAKYTKNVDPSKDEDLRVELQMAIAILRGHLAYNETERFLCGAEPTLADCQLLPVLYVLQNATAHFKGFSLDNFPRGDEVRDYYERGSMLPAFADNAYGKEACIAGWGAERDEK